MQNRFEELHLANANMALFPTPERLAKGGRARFDPDLWIVDEVPIAEEVRFGAKGIWQLENAVDLLAQQRVVVQAQGFGGHQYVIKVDGEGVVDMWELRAPTLRIRTLVEEIQTEYGGQAPNPPIVVRGMLVRAHAFHYPAEPALVLPRITFQREGDAVVGVGLDFEPEDHQRLSISGLSVHLPKAA